MTYMFILKCALKLVEEIIQYYDARSKKHKKTSRTKCLHDIPKDESTDQLVNVFLGTLNLLIMSPFYISNIRLKVKAKLFVNLHLYGSASLRLTAWRLGYFKLNSVISNVIYYVQERNVLHKMRFWKL